MVQTTGPGLWQAPPKMKFVPEERLIVAADYRPPSGTPNPVAWTYRQVLWLADRLQGMGIYLKVNSALRAIGYILVEELRARGLKVFADLKLFDISETLTLDGMLLQEYKPEIVTVSCGAGWRGLEALKAALPDSELLGVTLLSSLDGNDALHLHGCPTTTGAVLKLAHIARQAQLGVVCAPTDAEVIVRNFKWWDDNFTINAAGIRPEGIQVIGDDQNPKRTMTPPEAIDAGVTRIIIGRPVTQSKDPRGMVTRLLAEIADATA